MAVTITDVELAAELRIGDGATALDAPLAGIINRLLGTASAIAEEYAPDAPPMVQDEAVVRISGLLYDNAPEGNRRFSDVLANSGAISILSPFRVLRALSIEDAVASAAGGGTGDLSLIAVWARAGNDDPIPPEKLINAPSASGVDQTARDAAAAAQTTADNAHTEIDNHEGSQHNLDQTARDAAAAAQAAAVSAQGTAVNAQGTADSAMGTAQTAQQAADAATSQAAAAHQAAQAAHDLASTAQLTADGKQDQLTDAQLHALAESAGLDDKTADLVVVSDEEWARVAQDGSEGQLTIFVAAPDLDGVQDTGLTWTTRVVYNAAGLGADWVAARLPVGTDSTSRSTELNGLRSRFSNWDLLGSNATYDFWIHRLHTHVGTLHLDILTSSDHYTEFDGHVPNARFAAPDGSGNLAGDVDTVQELVNAVDGLPLGGAVSQAQVYRHLLNILTDGEGVYSEANDTDSEITLNVFTVHPPSLNNPTDDLGNDGDWWVQVAPTGVVALYYKSSGTWNAHNIPGGTGGGATISGGTGNPSGGESGDLYIQHNSDEVEALWLNLLGVWTEYPVEVRYPAGNTFTVGVTAAANMYATARAVPNGGLLQVMVLAGDTGFCSSFLTPVSWIRALTTVEDGAAGALGTNALAFPLTHNRHCRIGWNAAGNLMFGTNNANAAGTWAVMAVNVRQG